jgi:hypothetical protein
VTNAIAAANESLKLRAGSIREPAALKAIHRLKEGNKK